VLWHQSDCERLNSTPECAGVLLAYSNHFAEVKKMVIYFLQRDNKESVMGAIAFDTLAYAKKLKAVGVPEEQAEVQAETIAEVMDERMATKRDSDDLEMRLKAESDATKRDLGELEMRLKADLRLEIEKLRGEVAKEIAITKADLVRWQIGLAFGIIGILFALMKLSFSG
jgi:hypothetical protein